MNKKLIIFFAVILGLTLGIGIFAFSLQIIYGANFTARVGFIHAVSYFYWLPFLLGLIFIYWGIGFHLSKQKTRKMILIFSVAVLAAPYLLSIFHPFSNPNFPEKLEPFCENPQQLAETSFTPSTAPPYQISPAESNKELYRLLPRSWRAQNIKNTRIVLCTSPVSSEIVEEKTYEIEGQLPLKAVRLRYVQTFYLVDAVNGKRIAVWDGFGSEPEPFPEFPNDPFQEGEPVYFVTGSKHTTGSLKNTILNLLKP